MCVCAFLVGDMGTASLEFVLTVKVDKSIFSDVIFNEIRLS